LANTAYLIGDKRTYADISIFPFIRQFMNVDRNWFNNSEYKKIKEWLESLIESDLFKKAMVKPNLD
jgi:glutathione S-transferase